MGKTRLLELADEALGEKARLVSLHDLCSWLLRILRERDDLDEVMEETSPLQVDDESFEALQSIVGRRYDSIQWYAAEVADSPFEPIVNEAVVPYFAVSEGDAQYEMSEMGLGELAAHVLLWVLWYLREKHDLFILLDEPDAFFPPSSREALIDHIGSVAIRRQQAFVITTHSRELIERGLMYENVLTYMRRANERVEFSARQPAVREIVENVLYPEDALQVVAWVEDDAAWSLARALMSRIDRPLSRRVAFYWANGEGALKSLQEHLPRPERLPRSLEFMLLWDGDQEGRELNANHWPGVVLPGGMAPDALFMKSADAAALGSGLRVSEEVLEAALDKAAGKDAHDWTADLIELSGLERSAALSAIAEATLDSNPDLVEEFRKALINSGLDAFRILET